ncbi:MAG: HNH endonuclease [Candidatus Pacearchaeota archaeon]|nr:HNH endonuclease [Candidatus Pacearchaeota archaeon]
MINTEKPHFIIKNNPQKGGYKYSEVLTAEILKDICLKVTGRLDYTCEFEEEGYNKGRLAILKYNGITNYVSFSENGKIRGRNYFFQSLTTALVRYYSSGESEKKIYFYFMPLEGSIETNYFMFIYRLMATAGVNFLNSEDFLKQSIVPFNTVDDIIMTRDRNKSQNKSNNSTYITKNSEGVVEIYGKTYGASKKEAALLCIAISHLVQRAELYEICEQELTKLPGPDIKVITSLGNIGITATNLTMERNELEKNNSLRSPRFNYNLLEKLGAKKCAFCDCQIPELIEGAHIWPVSDIKSKSNLSMGEKVICATDGENGIWLCGNHHKILDKNLIKINEDGNIEYLSELDKEMVEHIRKTTPITKIVESIITEKFIGYLNKRNKLLSEKDYSSF